MSTRANISIAIKPEDMGTKKQFDAEEQSLIGFCVMKDCDKQYPLRYNKIIKFHKRPEVTLNKPYLSIFSHWDGYPGHIGSVLLERYRCYDDVLNLLLAGDMESMHYEYIDPSYDYFKAVKDEKNAEFCMPTNDDEPLCEHEFSYLFRDDEWYVKGHDIEEYTLLKEIVADIILGKRDEYGCVYNNSFVNNEC